MLLSSLLFCLTLGLLPSGVFGALDDRTKLANRTIDRVSFFPSCCHCVPLCCIFRMHHYYFVPKSKLDGYISFSLTGDEDVLDLVDIQQRLFMLTRFAHTYTKLNKTIPNANVRFTDSLPSYTFTIRPLHWPRPTKSVRKSLYTVLIIYRPLLIAK